MSLSVLSKKLVGFLEIIPEHQFRVLQRLHYPSLYSFKYSADGNEAKTYYFVLFETVALCNSSQETHVDRVLELRSCGRFASLGDCHDFQRGSAAFQ